MYPGFSEYHFGRCHFPNINAWIRLRESSHISDSPVSMASHLIWLSLFHFFLRGCNPSTFAGTLPNWHTANVINEYFIMSGRMFGVYFPQQICVLPFSLKMNLFHVFSQHFFQLCFIVLLKKGMSTAVKSLSDLWIGLHKPIPYALLFQLLCGANNSTNFLLYNIFSNEKKATKQRFHNKKCVSFGKYAQTLRTYLLINSSFALKHLLCMLPHSLYIGSSGTLFSLSLSLSLAHTLFLCRFIIFYYLPRRIPKKANWIVYFYDSISLRSFVQTLFIFLVLCGNKPRIERYGKKTNLHTKLTWSKCIERKKGRRTSCLARIIAVN